MFRRTVSGVLLILLLTSMVTLAFNTGPAKASGTIYIRADGSIDPPTALISTVDRITYTFTDNTYDGIVLQRSNIIIDGNGYAVQGDGSVNGLYLDVVHHVTIKNMNIKTCSCGIVLSFSSGNSVIGNNIANNGDHGILLADSCSDNSIIGNSITANIADGIYLYSGNNNNNLIGNNVANNGGGIALADSCSDNSIIGNNVANNGDDGILLINSCSGNRIIENNIIANEYGGIGIQDSSDNRLYHNNFVNNPRQTGFYGYPPNVWDDDYPSGGNYWSDYTGIDANGDGIGDTPYTINRNNIDHYPLMRPWGSSAGATVIINCGDGGSISYSSSYGSGTVLAGQNTDLQVPSGTQISLAANPDSAHCFQTWGAGGPVSIPLSDLSLPSATATINGNGGITAYFGLKTVTSTSVTCSPNSVSGSLSVVCTAIVSPFNPTGSVAWTTFPEMGSFSPSTCILMPTSAGLCSTTYTPDVSSGTTAVTITATYSGDTNNEASSGSCKLGSVKDPNSGSGFNPSLQLANGIAQPNLYLLDSSVGKVQQIYDNNGLSTWIQLSEIQTGPHIPFTNIPSNLGPVGFTEVGYGRNLRNDMFGKSSSGQPQFPITISSLDSLNLWGTATYSLSSNPSPSDMPYHYFYDLWLEKDPSKHWPQPGDFEVGISLAHGGQIGTNPYEPAGSLVGYLTDQIYVNGQQRSATWNIFFELAKGTNMLDYSQPFYDFSLVSPSPQNDGTVSVRFQDFVDCLSQLSGGKDISAYELMGIELGTEYSWSVQRQANRQATWSWTISSYYLTTNSNNFMTIVTSANAPGQVSRPPPTVSPQLTLIPLASEATGAVASISHAGSAVAATVDQTITTGVKTIISGLSLQVGTELGVGSLYYGANQPPGTSLVQVGGTFFDVKVHALSDTLGSDVSAAVYLTNSGFTASSTISYWDGSKWVSVATAFIMPDTVWCTLLVSILMETPIMVLTPAASVGGEWAPINTVQLMTPWIALVFLAIAFAAAGSHRLLRKRL